MSVARAQELSTIDHNRSAVAGSVPVIVMGDGLTATGVVRSLGRAGIPRYCITSDCNSLSASRWYTALPKSFGAAPKPRELADFLSRLPIESAVLMPCADDWLEAVAELPAALLQKFPASICSPQSVRACVDKATFAQVLQKHELPHPRTRILDSVSDMQALGDEFYEGCFLKPVASLAFGRRHGVKAFLIRNKAEALERMGGRDSHRDFPILLQDYIPGPPTSHFFIDGFADRQGSLSVLFARQRIRMYPPLLGNSTLMETVDLGRVAGAVETIRTLCAVLRYRGIFSAEFKYDDRDGRFKILEVNARPWWFIEFAAKCHVDVSSMAYLDALGLPVEPVFDYEPGIRCVHVLKDFKAFRHDSNGSFNVFRWLNSWVGAKDAVFSWDDPRPAIAYMSEMLSYNIKQARLK